MNEELEHWKLLINTVFTAEDAIKEQWLPQLKAAKDMTPPERLKIADAYVTAIANEILSKGK